MTDRELYFKTFAFFWSFSRSTSSDNSLQHSMICHTITCPNNYLQHSMICHTIQLHRDTTATSWDSHLQHKVTHHTRHVPWYSTATLSAMTHKSLVLRHYCNTKLHVTQDTCPETLQQQVETVLCKLSSMSHQYKPVSGNALHWAQLLGRVTVCGYVKHLHIYNRPPRSTQPFILAHSVSKSSTGLSDWGTGGVHSPVTGGR